MAFVINYAVIAVPFVFSGICVSLALTKFPGRVGRLHAIDLAGAALGCAAVEVRDTVAAVELQLKPGCRVRGRVADLAGRPAGGLIVLGAPRQPGSMACKLGFRLARTNRSGEFELRGVPAGAAVLAVVQPELGRQLAVESRDLVDRDCVEWFPVIRSPGGDSRSVTGLETLRQWVALSASSPVGPVARAR